MMTMLKMMMMMKEITSQFVLWGRAVRPNFLGAECATDDCTGKQPDHHFDDDFDFDDHHFDDDFGDDRHHFDDDFYVDNVDGL